MSKPAILVKRLLILPDHPAMARITDMPLEIFHSIFAELAALEPPIATETSRSSRIAQDGSFWEYQAYRLNHRDSPPGLRLNMRCGGRCKIWHSIIREDYRASINRERQFLRATAKLVETVWINRRYLRPRHESESKDRYFECLASMYRE